MRARHAGVDQVAVYPVSAANHCLIAVERLVAETDPRLEIRLVKTDQVCGIAGLGRRRDGNVLRVERIQDIQAVIHHHQFIGGGIPGV